MIERQIVRYCAVGALNTAIGLAFIYLAMYALGLGMVASNALGYLVGAVLSYGLNRLWTFEHRGAIGRSAWRFAVVLGVSYTSNLGAVIFAREVLLVNPYAAQMFGVVLYTVLTFLGSRHFAFPPHTSEPVSGRLGHS